MTSFDQKGELLDYVRYHGLDELCQVDAKSVELNIDPHRGKSWHEGVVEHSIPCNWPDLVRLHKIVLDRRVTTVLEFGIGYSTLVLAHALNENKIQYKKFVKENLRKNNAFEVHSVDADQHFINTTQEKVPNDIREIARFCKSDVVMGEWCGRICTFYERLPNICPDLIYIDGPSRYHPQNSIRNISTSNPDRMPMSADVLSIEYFLLPGTVIIIDGRTANARFLKNNLQRDWNYQHFIDQDYHLFELVEEPLGLLNRVELEWKSYNMNND